MKEDKNIDKLLEKFSKGKCTSEEEKIVDHYLDSFQDTTIESIENEQAIKQRIYRKIQMSIEAKKHKHRQHRNRKVFINIAAAITAIIGIGILFQLLTKETIYTEMAALGERKTVYLPDGSKVALNAGSTLQYTSSFNDEKREVRLNGEGFFEVSHNKEKPFIVTTTHLKTRVLGTSFNINSYKENKEVKVSVATGKVEVSVANHQKEYLIKNEQLRFNPLNNTYKKEYYNSVNDIAWKDNIILFNDISVDSAFKKLEKWFNVSIVVTDENLKKEHINGKFKDSSLEEVLEGLQFSLQFYVEHTKENELIIKKKP